MEKESLVKIVTDGLRTIDFGHLNSIDPEAEFYAVILFFRFDENRLEKGVYGVVSIASRSILEASICEVASGRQDRPAANIIARGLMESMDYCRRDIAKEGFSWCDAKEINLHAIPSDPYGPEECQ